MLTSETLSMGHLYSRRTTAVFKRKIDLSGWDLKVRVRGLDLRRDSPFGPGAGPSHSGWIILTSRLETASLL